MINILKHKTKHYLLKLWHGAASYNNELLISYIEPAKTAKVLDIGCDSGKLIIERVQNITKPTIYGIDIRPEALSTAKKLGIRTKLVDVESGLPFKSNFFDVVSANQIIEHLVNVDQFTAEIYRVLKPGGYLVLATENLSSWHNIFALVAGWQAFSQHISSISAVGNPFRIVENGPDIREPASIHIKIFSPRGLKELLEINDFKIEKFFGAGYYPFPDKISRIFTKIDLIHSAFIGLKARKLSK